MRIISGKYKSRVLKGYDMIGTRPTMDRVKESIFAILQNKIKNSVVLDLFAGTGSLGIEAISNECATCFFVEKNKKMALILKQNLENLKINNCNLFVGDYNEALKQYKKDNIKFDLIFLDPPYQMNLINEVLNKIYNLDLLSEFGQVICEYENEGIENDKYKTITTRKYGSKYIKIFSKK